MASVDAKLRWIRAAEMRFGLHGGAVQVQTRRTTVWGRVESREKSNSVAIAIFYSIAAITIAAYGYGIGGVSSLQAGAIYAVVGFVLAFACVGFAPRFVVVVALATGMLGSMMRASIAPEMTSLIPRQTTIDYLQRMMAVCAAIGFGGGLYGGFRFTGKGFFNWISKWVLTRLPASSAPPLPVHSHVMRELARHFHTSERMYFSALAAFGSALVAEVEAKPTPLPRSLLIIALAVFIATNLAWFVGEWLRPRLRVLGGVFRILQQMWEALLAFLLGYTAIIFIFACFYAAAWQHNRASAFQGINLISPVPPSFGQFVYFSVVTMATLGYGDVIPADALTRTLACVEVVIGVGWVTVVLSAASALARPRVDQMLKQVWQEEGETDPDQTPRQPKTHAAVRGD